MEQKTYQVKLADGSTKIVKGWSILGGEKSATLYDKDKNVVAIFPAWTTIIDLSAIDAAKYADLTDLLQGFKAERKELIGKMEMFKNNPTNINAVFMSGKEQQLLDVINKLEKLIEQ